MENKLEIYIDPLCKLNYASYFIVGFVKIGITIKYKCFDIPIVQDRNEYKRGMFCKTSSGRKIYIDFHDKSDYNINFYEWCDEYVKVNYQGTVPSKMIIVGPVFGISLPYSRLKVLKLGAVNFMKLVFCHRDQYIPPFISYIGDYAYTFLKRRSFENYTKDEADTDVSYCFTANTLWYDPLTDATTNQYRADFCFAAKKVFRSFEGGLKLLKSNNVIDEFPRYIEYKNKYAEIIMKTPFSMDEYISKTKRTYLVFNTPSVEGCLGWKLGEYLSMGKCILSTPLNQFVFPSEFLPGIHYFEIKDINHIKQSIIFLLNNPDIVKRFENASRTYFLKNLSPDIVAKTIIASIK